MTDDIDLLLDDDDRRPPVGALEVVRRGMAVSPELRNGLGVTILLGSSARAGGCSYRC